MTCWYKNETNSRDGRFLRLDCLIMGFKLSIVNVYLPNDAVKRNEFIEELTMRLNQSNPFVLCGDFNFIMDFDLDIRTFNQTLLYRSKRSYHTSSVRTFDNLIQIHKLIDVYRVMEPADREYTFYNDFYKTGTRLDRIYMSRLNVDCLFHVEHLPIALSDPRAMSLELKLEGRKLGRGYWKCNVSTLKDSFFIDDLNEMYKSFLTECDGGLRGQQWETFKVKVKRLNIAHSQRLAANRKSKLDALENRWRNTTD